MNAHREARTSLGASPVLDIGGDVGAIVVHLTDVPDSRELEAWPVGDHGRRFHTGVHVRDVNGRSVPVAVYPSVREGDYEILDSDLRPVARVRVDGGEVSEVRLDLAAAR